MHGFYTHSNISYSVFINYVDIYKSVTNYKNNSQMFEIVFHIKLSVSFLFFSNSGTTCCLHCSSETKIPVILFNESSFVKYQEILSLHKGQGLKYSAFDLPDKMDKSYSCNMECYWKFTALSKAQREKLNCLKNTWTNPSNNTNNLSWFQDTCSSMM